MTRKLVGAGLALIIVLVVSGWSIAAFAPAGFAGSARAQTDDASVGRTVRAQGQGTATMPAESLTVRFVFGSDQFSDTGPVPITEDNLRPVIDALIGIGVDAGAISVVALPGMYGPPGTLALQIVVAQPMSDWVQQIVDTGSSAAGAAGLMTYEVGGRFSVSDCGPLVAQAQVAAVENAQQQASALSNALGAVVGDWVSAATFSYHSESSSCQAFEDPYGETYYPPIDFTQPMEVRVMANVEVTYAAN